MTKEIFISGSTEIINEKLVIEDDTDKRESLQALRNK